MTNGKLGVAIHGAGWVAGAHLRSWLKNSRASVASGDVEHHPFDGVVNHLVDCILGGRESHCDIADAFHTHEVCLAIDRALETAGPVKLPL